MKNRFDYLDKLRLAATFMVFALHIMAFKGKDFYMHDILKDSGGWFILFSPAWGGVWIFFVLSGYLAGLGFYNGIYDLNIKDVWRYYYKKLRKIYMPTVLYLCFAVIIVQPYFFEDWHIILQIITCTYDGRPGFNGGGVTWFVFTLMWCYLATPLLCKICGGNWNIKVLFFCVSLCGLAIRLFWYWSGNDWYTIYTSPLGNIDLFFCGFCIPYILRSMSIPKSKLLKVITLVCFILLVLENSYSMAYSWHIAFYQYVSPSLYLLLTCMYIILFSGEEQNNASSFLHKLGAFLCGISFEIYLVHSLVFERLSPHIGGSTATGQYFKFLIVASVVTLLFAIGWKRIFRRI